MEGAHALEGDLNNVDRLFALGYRIIGLTHFFDNEVGGSAHGIDKYGITPFGGMFWLGWTNLVCLSTYLMLLMH